MAANSWSQGGGEQTPLTPPKTPIPETERAKSGTPDARDSAQTDPELALIQDRWPELPEHIRQAVLTLVHANPAKD